MDQWGVACGNDAHLPNGGAIATKFRICHAFSKIAGARYGFVDAITHDAPFVSLRTACFGRHFPRASGFAYGYAVQAAGAEKNNMLP